MAELVLQTPRLVLRPLAVSDAPAVLAALDADRIWLASWLRAPARLRSAADVEDWISRSAADEDAFRWGAFAAGGGELLGCMGLQRKFCPHEIDLSYWLRRRYTGFGYAREAVGALTAFAERLPDARALTIHCEPRNVASRRVALGCGFVAVRMVSGAEPPLERFEYRGAVLASAPP